MADTTHRSDTIVWSITVVYDGLDNDVQIGVEQAFVVAVERVKAMQKVIGIDDPIPRMEATITNSNTIKHSVTEREIF